jgi:hypothetical protein
MTAVGDRVHWRWVLLWLLVIVATGAGDSGAQVKPGAALLTAEPVEINATPLAHFQKSQPERRRFGRLEWRGGLVLTSPSSDFGGWSGLVLSPDGRQILSVSDAGSWLSGEITYSGDRPIGIRNAREGPLLGIGGKRLSRLRDRDAEGVTLAGGTLAKGTVLVSFEGNHRIGRFPVNDQGISAPLGYLSLPAEAQQMKRNQGFEAVSIIQGGSLTGAVIAFSEHFLDVRGHHTGWIWQGSAAPVKIHLAEHGGFDITDAASLPDGGLLVLERRFRWTEGVKFRMRLIPAREIVPEAVLEGETLIEADMDFEIDNMEGIAVHHGPRGETIITLISDDNFNHLLQRTVLLQFRLTSEAEARVTSGQRPPQ